LFKLERGRGGNQNQGRLSDERRLLLNIPYAGKEGLTNVEGRKKIKRSFIEKTKKENCGFGSD